MRARGASIDTGLRPLGANGCSSLTWYWQDSMPRTQPLVSLTWARLCLFLEGGALAQPYSILPCSLCLPSPLHNGTLYNIAKQVVFLKTASEHFFGLNLGMKQMDF